MPADWPSSGGADSQAPRWAVASLSRSAADACGVAAANAATIAAMPTITFTFPACCIVAPVLLTKAGAVSLEVMTASRPRGERAGALIARMDRVIPSARYRRIRSNAWHRGVPRSQHRAPPPPLCASLVGEQEY